jgi:hypothetical protein
MIVDNTLTAEGLKRNQNLLLFAFLYTVFHGGLRKWVFSGAINNVLFFVQLLLPFVLIFFMRRERSWTSYTPLLPYAFCLVLLGLNPLNGSIYHGIFGFIMHFGFWLLMFAYIHERDAFPLENLVQPFLIACGIEIAVSFLQFGLPSDHFLNRYESGDGPSGFLSGAVRVVGTFSYIGGFAAFVYFVGLFSWALMVENKRPFLAVFGLSFMGMIAGFMNGSRSMVLPFVICLIFGLWSYGNFTNKIKLLFLLPILVGAAIIFEVDKKFPALNTAYTAFMGRVDSGRESGESNARVNETVIEIFTFDCDNPIFGLGLGGTYQGATQLWGKSEALLKYGYYEEEPERILLEGGYFLFFFRICLFIFLISQLRVPPLLMIPLAVYMILITPMVSNTFQASCTFWGLAMLDKMYYLKEKAAATEGVKEAEDEADLEAYENFNLS